jgi:hypothetical protein
MQFKLHLGRLIFWAGNRAWMRASNWWNTFSTGGGEERECGERRENRLTSLHSTLQEEAVEGVDSI